MSDIEFKIDCVYPETLLTEPTPEGVWMRMEHVHMMGCLISVRGPNDAVKKYIRDEWGDDAVEMLVKEGSLK